VVHDIPEEDKVCACCNGELHKIGEDKSEKLEFIPAQVKVIEHVRPKYACRACEKDGTQNKIKQAPVPASIIPKGYATPSLLSQIITSKYQYGLPLYRQEAMFKQYGIDLSRKTMAQWMIKSQLALQILYERLREILLQQSVIQADETTLKVIGEAKTTCYMWLYCSGTDSPQTKSKDSSIPNIVLYDYQNSRRGQCAADSLRVTPAIYKWMAIRAMPAPELFWWPVWPMLAGSSLRQKPHSPRVKPAKQIGH
jgi:transposase